MNRADAISQASELGYTIQYDMSEDEIRFRKPGSAMSALGVPYEYCRVYKRCASWLIEERVEPKIL
jgi:hypothetical protein